MGKTNMYKMLSIPNPLKMKINKNYSNSLGILLSSLTLVVGTLPNPAMAKPVSRQIALQAGDTCSFSGNWGYEGKRGPYIVQTGNRIQVNMRRYNRPNATGRVINASTIEVNFPDDATFTGELDGQGNLNWSNGTVWNSTGGTNFAGAWKYQGRLGPNVNSVAKSDGTHKLKIDMRRYSRPNATGTATGPIATVNFPDDGTFTGTLVTPSCIKWSNNTMWNK
jgi:hypothetical protein